MSICVLRSLIGQNNAIFCSNQNCKKREAQIFFRFMAANKKEDHQIQRSFYMSVTTLDGN